MGFAADVVLEADFVAQIVEEANLEIARVVHRIVYRHDVLELRRADLAPAFGDLQRIGMRSAGGVEERFLVEAAALDNKRVAFPTSDRVAVVERVGDQLLIARI